MTAQSVNDCHVTLKRELTDQKISYLRFEKSFVRFAILMKTAKPCIKREEEEDLMRNILGGYQEISEFEIPQNTSP